MFYNIHFGMIRLLTTFCSVCLFVSKPQTWVALQRKEHKLHPGGNASESKSRRDRYEKLERNGFLWDVEDS